MKASDAVALLLAHKQVTVGFELIGGMITHLVDSIVKLGKTKLVSVHHEQGAAFAAGGVARATNYQSMGVALGTSGPGATNLLTGVADCWLDNVPCLFFTGQVNMHESKGVRQIKQQGFQELEIISMVQSITKYAKKIESVHDLLPEINKAIDIARSGRPGPVLLDIPMNIQREAIDEQQLQELLALPLITHSAQTISTEDIATLFSKVRDAKKPLVLLGGGAVNDALMHQFLEVLQAQNIPYVASLKGSEKIAAQDIYYGMIGSYGMRVANYALQNCDLLLVLGSRLDVRQTGANCEDFARCAYTIQIDIDEHQLNNRVTADWSLQADINSFYQAYLQMPVQRAANSAWIDELNSIRQATFVNEYKEFHLNPFKIFCLMNEKFAGRKIQFVADVGNNQMWAAHSVRLGSLQKIHHSGGLGAMGFGLPTTLGVHLATKEPVVCFSGDGGMHLNIQELDIIAREQLPILIFVLNNKALGMVKNFQDMYFDGRNQSTFWGIYSCDFVTIAQGYNVEARKASTLEQIAHAIDDFLAHNRPLLIEIDIDQVHECRPRLSFGDKLDNQSPKLELPQ